MDGKFGKHSQIPEELRWLTIQVIALLRTCGYHIHGRFGGVDIAWTITSKTLHTTRQVKVYLAQCWLLANDLDFLLRAVACSNWKYRRSLPETEVEPKGGIYFEGDLISEAEAKPCLNLPSYGWVPCLASNGLLNKIPYCMKGVEDFVITDWRSDRCSWTLNAALMKLKSSPKSLERAFGVHALMECVGWLLREARYEGRGPCMNCTYLCRVDCDGHQWSGLWHFAQKKKTENIALSTDCMTAGGGRRRLHVGRNSR